MANLALAKVCFVSIHYPAPLLV